MELWSAALLGLAGSLHCVGMCGPIAISLPNSGGSRARLIIERISYNVGRAITYGLLGVGGGLIGQTLAVAGWQRWLSISLGLLIILAVLMPGRLTSKLNGAPSMGRMVGRMHTLWHKLLDAPGVGPLLLVGLLNGLLPCGLVYVALAGAMATGSVGSSALYMVIFGLGTLPIMMLVSLFGASIFEKFRPRLRKLLPAGAIFLALLLILRGMSLGIPYVSPKIEMESGTVIVSECCP